MTPADLTFDFMLDSSDDLDRQYDQLLQMVFALLAVVPGDAVLHYGYAEVWFVRRGTQLILNDRGGMWPARSGCLCPSVAPRRARFH